MKKYILNNKIFTSTDDNFFIMIGEQKNALRLNHLFQRKDGSEQITIEKVNRHVSRSKEQLTFHDTEQTLFSRRNVSYLNFIRQTNISSVKLAQYLEQNLGEFQEVVELQLLKAERPLDEIQKVAIRILAVMLHFKHKEDINNNEGNFKIFDYEYIQMMQHSFR